MTHPIPMTRKLFRERTISTKHGNMRMRYLRRASSLDVVLVHGLIVCSSFMEPTANYLAKNYNVFLPDLLGHGKSETPEQPVTIADHAESLLEALEEMGVTAPILVGGSYGCQVIVELANHLDAQALVFVGPTPGGKFGKAFSDLSTDAFREPRELVFNVIKEVFHIGPGRVAKLLEDMASYPFHDRLESLQKIPTLVVRGQHDPFFRADFVDGAAQKIRNCRGICMPKSAHGLPFSEPEIVSNFIEHFLESTFHIKAA